MAGPEGFAPIPRWATPPRCGKTDLGIPRRSATRFTRAPRLQHRRAGRQLPRGAGPGEKSGALATNPAGRDHGVRARKPRTADPGLSRTRALLTTRPVRKRRRTKMSADEKPRRFNDQPVRSAAPLPVMRSVPKGASEPRRPSAERCQSHGEVGARTTGWRTTPV